MPETAGQVSTCDAAERERWEQAVARAVAAADWEPGDAQRALRELRDTAVALIDIADRLTAERDEQARQVERLEVERTRLTTEVSDAYTACYLEVEAQARKVDPDLEGYSVGELAQNMRLMLQGWLEEARDERDQAGAALERVRALHGKTFLVAQSGMLACEECSKDAPCPTDAALSAPAADGGEVDIPHGGRRIPGGGVMADPEAVPVTYGSMSGPRAEDGVAGWLTAALADHLAAHGTVYLKGGEYSVESADDDDPDSVLVVLTRVSDGRRFEAVIDVDAIELPAATSTPPDAGGEGG
jgi:hypothetical protein